MTDQQTTDVAEPEEETSNLPPKVPRLPPGEWMKKNLFSSVGNSILTVVFVLVILAITRGLLGFAFSPERRWDATATNMRLLFAGAYPQNQFVRMWVSLGIVVALGGLSTGVWRAGGRMYLTSLLLKGYGVGGAVVLVGILAPFSGSARLSYFLVGGLLIAASFAVQSATDEDTTVGTLAVGLVGVSIAVGSFWVIPYGHHAFIDGAQVVSDGTVAATTKGPLTVMVILAVLTYFLGREIADRVDAGWPRKVLSLSWLASPVVIVFFVLRDPDFDYGHIATTEVPIFLAYAVGGGLLLFALASPRIGEVGRIIAAVTLIAAAATFLTPMLQVIRILALMLAVFALAAPTFSGNRAARLRYVTVWAGVVLGLLWLITAINSPATVESNSSFFTGGLALTLIVASFTMILSFPLGVILALARTSNMPLFRVMSTTYIEFVRGVPFITILIFFSVLFPLFLPENMEVTEIAAVTIGFTLFSAAYMAENVRGGLQSIRRGQYEAAEALGMTTAQKTVFIILPQALRVSIPPLVGQTIGTYKETSLLAIIGLFDLLFVARSLIPNQTSFIGSVREQLLFASVIYWMGAYAMSRASQNLERKLGVGER